MAKGEVLPELAAGIDGAATREPVGICAGITPFNFPAMVPMWMYPLAIACGNCFVLKPSEKVPFTANRLAELFVEAGLPPGVMNVVHGGRDVVEALCRHPGIAAISFVGSSPVARRVYELTGQTGKRCQAAGGAKNVLLVMPDAVESGLFGEAAAADPTLNAVMHSAFGCAGQRCMAGSLLMGIGDASDGLRDQLASAMDTMTVGDTLRDDVDMGPVIDSAARQRLVGHIAGAASADLTVVRDGREGVPETGFYVGRPCSTASTRPRFCSQRSCLARSWDFAARDAGPGDRLDQPHPVRQCGDHFHPRWRAARTFTRGVQCGMIGVNVGVPAPMALFSFPAGTSRSSATCTCRGPRELCSTRGRRRCCRGGSEGSRRLSPSPD